MTKKLHFLIIAFLFTQTVMGQSSEIVQDRMINYFNEIKTATTNNQQLWDMNIYGPILLVNPSTRQILSNVADSKGVLKTSGEIYTGVLPDDVNIANTAIDWNGTRWAMICLPLPDDANDRINLLAHELFHKAQPALGFKIANPENNQLNQKEGRIYLRLELEALKKAIGSVSVTEMKNHLTNALIFRKYRYELYPGSDSTENILELNEGIAEYTGAMMSGRNKEQMVAHFQNSIDLFMQNQTFVRSFAYQTTPVYGYLLNQSKNDWNKRITNNTNLTNYFIKAFDLTLTDDLNKAIQSVANQYNYNTINDEETTRKDKTDQLIAILKGKFIEQPHFDIQLEKMNVSFDPRNIIPLEDKGTIYPNVRITDLWGILTVEKGALMSPGWNMISVTIPLKIEDKIISGDGWKLVLNDGYKIIEDEKTDNYKLTKK
jgi:hypothetical protein